MNLGSNHGEAGRIFAEKHRLHRMSSSYDEVKLAAVAVSLNVRLRSSDMPVHMQERALRYTKSLLDDKFSPSSSSSRPNPTLLAQALKKEFDSAYGPAWHCVIGKSFGSYVTHSPGGFIYFSVDSLSFLLFDTTQELIEESDPIDSTEAEGRPRRRIAPPTWHQDYVATAERKLHNRKKKAVRGGR